VHLIRAGRQVASLSLLVVAALASGCATAPGALPPAPAQDTLVPAPVPVAPTALGGFGALAGAPVPSSSVIVPDCVPRSGPPYQIGAVGSFGGGAVTVIPGVSVSGISGRFCAVATLVPAPASHPTATVCAELVAPKDGLQFDPVETRINLIPTVTTVIGNVAVSPEAFSAFLCDDGEPGQLKLDTTIKASAVPRVFGTECLVGPLQASVTGTFTGPLTGVTATLVSGTFPVSAVQPAPLCPAGLAQNTNEILGLPLAQSVGGLSITTNAALYLPPPV